MSEIIKTAVKLTNESNQEAVERAGVRLISLILGEQATIRSCNGRIAEDQKALKGIADSSITLSGVMGGVDLRDDGNPNTATIIKAIERANHAAQDSVNIVSTNLIANISGEQKNIEACNQRIATLRAELSKLSAEAVSVKDVTGN